MSGDDLEQTHRRLSEALLVTAKREQQLGREGFLVLSEKLRHQLAALQAQCAPKEPTLEAMLGAEHLLKTYNERLDDAFNITRQVENEGMRQRQRRKRRVWIGGAASVVIVGLASAAWIWLSAAMAAKERHCQKAPACGESGLCGVALRGAPSWDIECAAGSDEDCRASASCRELGRCSQERGECVAARDEDCRALSRCKDHGLCHARSGECAATSIEDCRSTKACAAVGACTPVEGLCRPGSDDDCRRSALCKTAQACIEIDGRCVVDENTVAPRPQAPGTRGDR